MHFIVSLGCQFVFESGFCKLATENLALPMYNKIIERFLNEKVICTRLEFCIYPVIVPGDEKGFISRVLSDKPPVSRPRVRHVENPLKFVVFADVHVDHYYEEGSDIECDLPLCCRNTYKTIYGRDINVTSPKNGKKAGKWGAIGHCDIPFVLFQFILRSPLNPSLTSQ